MLCSVIPPHILRHVADGGRRVDTATRESASRTLAEMESHAAVPTPAALKAPFFRDVSAANGSGRRRNVYDAQHGRKLPGRLVRSERMAIHHDAEVNDAFDGAGETYDFFRTVYGRNSIDGHGLRLDSTVHYGWRFDNAFWDGRQLVYGDGDGKLFLRFTPVLDVVAHEYTHGMTQYAAGLGYTGQNGALNEHISDVFGILVKQASRGLTAAQSDWILGEGLFGPTVKGKGIRSMAAPGTAYDDPVLGRDPQPAHMDDYVETSDDNGGVHVNSGIPNRAFYLAATAVGGPAWESVGRVWYIALTHLEAAAGFQAFATATTLVAGTLFGSNGKLQRAVRDAWQRVGLSPAGVPPVRRPVLAPAPPLFPSTAVTQTPAQL